MLLIFAYGVTIYVFTLFACFCVYSRKIAYAFFVVIFFISSIMPYNIFRCMQVLVFIYSHRLQARYRTSCMAWWWRRCRWLEPGTFVLNNSWVEYCF